MEFQQQQVIWNAHTYTYTYMWGGKTPHIKHPLQKKQTTTKNNNKQKQKQWLIQFFLQTAHTNFLQDEMQFSIFSRAMHFQTFLDFSIGFSPEWTYPIVNELILHILF